jgi:hypothetical protein
MSGADPAAEPPFVLDAALVLRYALLEPGATGPRPSVVIDGTPLDMGAVRRVVIARSLLDDRVFLMHCNADWETIVAVPYSDVDAAEAGAAEAYGALAPRWTAFRELSGEEAREVATTRAFLKEIAAED